MSQDSPCIEFQNLGKRFENRSVFDHLNGTIHTGESVALFGNNGSGKSTLLRLISLLQPASRGKLKLFGQEVDQNKGMLRSRLRFLSHEKRLYGSLSILENMKLAARIRGISDPQTIIDALKKMSLLSNQNKQARQLSEGLKKRLVLAGLLLGNPDLILLDEPYPTLDAESREILNQQIVEWRGNKKTIILASHDHDQALAHADRLLILENGTLKYDGAPK